MGVEFVALSILGIASEAFDLSPRTGQIVIVALIGLASWGVIRLFMSWDSSDARNSIPSRQIILYFVLLAVQAVLIALLATDGTASLTLGFYGWLILGLASIALIFVIPSKST